MPGGGGGGSIETLPGGGGGPGASGGTGKKYRNWEIVTPRTLSVT